MYSIRSLPRLSIAAARTIRPCTIAFRSIHASVPRRMAEALPNQPSQTKLAEKTMKRFWKTVNVVPVADGYNVNLDSRPLKTPSGTRLVIPHNKPHLAYLIAAEWNSLPTASIRQHSLPLTSLVSRYIDYFDSATAKDVTKGRSEAIRDLMRYIDTDTLVIWAESRQERLLELQKEHWTPLIKEAGEYLTKHAAANNLLKDTDSVKISVLEGDAGIIGHRQPPLTKSIAQHFVESLLPWELAAFERTVLHTKSFLLGILMIGRPRAIGVKDCARVATLEVEEQTRVWGEVEDTHDVEKADALRTLGSVAVLLEVQA
ncbi:Cu-binding protein [Saitoella coloradoensis]